MDMGTTMAIMALQEMRRRLMIKRKGRKRIMVVRARLSRVREMRNRKMAKMQRLNSKHQVPQANRVVLKIMMMGRRRAKGLNKQKNQRTEL
jgi:hypothetical protein